MRLIVALTALAVCLMASSCLGSSYSYKVSYHTGSTSSVETHVDLADGRDASSGSDGEAAWPAPSSSGVLVGIHKTNGTNGWNGTTGFYGEDIREAVSTGNSVTFDDIYLWATPGTESQDLHLHLQDGPSLDGLSLTLTLVSVPNGVTYTGPTEWGSETTDIALPFYSSDDGKTGYKFRVTITAAQ